MIERLTTQLVIVGAGPAGLAAANEASRHGLATLLVDDQPQPGGRLHKRRAGLTCAAGKSGAEIRSGISVFGISDRGSLLAEGPKGCPVLIESDITLLAPGAVERPFLIPGGTLKNVMSASIARRRGLIDALPEQGPVILAGHGPYLLATAARLAALGRPATAVLDTGRPLRFLGGRMLIGPHREKARRALYWMLTLHRHGTRYHHGCTNLHIEGRNGVAHRLQWVDAAGRPQDIAAAAVLLHDGLDPDITLPRAFEVPVHWNGQVFLPETDPNGGTPTDSLWLAGSVQGALGPDASIARGHLAALDICARSGRLSYDEAMNRADPWRRMLTREEDLGRRLASLAIHEQTIHKDVVVCPCQGVTAGMLHAAARKGSPGPNMAQAATGCATGACQGRRCASAMCRVLSAATHQDCEEIGLPRPRQPVRPVALGVLAAFGQTGS